MLSPLTPYCMLLPCYFTVLSSTPHVKLWPPVQVSLSNKGGSTDILAAKCCCLGGISELSVIYLYVYFTVTIIRLQVSKTGQIQVLSPRATNLMAQWPQKHRNLYLVYIFAIVIIKRTLDFFNKTGVNAAGQIQVTMQGQRLTQNAA